jgi:hypothetical protein
MGNFRELFQCIYLTDCLLMALFTLVLPQVLSADSSLELWYSDLEIHDRIERMATGEK